MSQSFQDDALVVVIARIPGVTVTHHYRGREELADNYYIHLSVEDEASLHRLCRLAEGHNAPLQVYEWGEGFRYTLIVNAWSRETLMLMSGG